MAIVDFDTECWGDPWVQALPPNAKLLFVYLWTNVHRNIAGLYVITKETISFDTKLPMGQLNPLFQRLSPKVQYDPDHCVCWVVKHARRQFLRGEKIAPKQREGIRRHALKLKWHPFFKSFLELYPELFSEEEKDTLLKGIDTHSMGMDTLGGGGKGGGNSFKEEIGVQGKEEQEPKLNSETLAAMYNEFCPRLIKSLKLSPDRRKDINLRIRENPDPAWWKMVFVKANKAYIPPSRYHPKGWRPDLEFLVKNSDNCIKVMEGKYDQGGETIQQPTSQPPGIPEAVQKMVKDMVEEGWKV